MNSPSPRNPKECEIFICRVCVDMTEGKNYMRGMSLSTIQGAHGNTVSMRLWGMVTISW